MNLKHILVFLTLYCTENTLLSAPLKQERIYTSSGSDTLNEIPDRLPEKKRSFVERADLSQDPSGFRIRGTKGWSWTPEQYLAEIPVLSEYKMNFLMNCYISMFTMPLHPDSLWKTTTVKNEWWLPIPDAKKKAYEKVFEKSREYGISFCFGVHPQLSSPRPADLSSEKDFEDIWQHYAWAQSKGVRWFSLPMDDVTGVKISGKEHALLVNKLLERLRVKDKDAQMVFCPTYYHVNPKALQSKEKTYLEELAKYLNKDVYVFWTGNKILPGTINADDAESFKNIVGHRVIIWENYPVNDAWKTLHLAPLTGRDKNLYKSIDGYMSNPHFTQNEINRIPLFTMAEYAYDPLAYDPAKSIGQAIIHQTDNKEQQQVLHELVKLYSSTITSGIGLNPVLDHFKKITAAPFSRHVADVYVEHLKEVQHNLNRLFPDRYFATKKTFAESISQVENEYRKKYQSQP